MGKKIESTVKIVDLDSAPEQDQRLASDVSAKYETAKRIYCYWMMKRMKQQQETSTKVDNT